MHNIGLVLAKTPAYSETFFISKISGLTKAGFNVTLFAPKSTDYIAANYPGVSIKEPYKIKTNKIWQAIITSVVVTKTLLLSPRATRKFIILERKDGKSVIEIIKSIYLNAHILPYSLDWLHFGFATMGLGHENTAKAIGAKSAVSFRGYDISIYPLKHPHCYDLLFEKIDKVHSISDDLYNEALQLGLSKKIPYERITPAIDSEKFSRTISSKNEGVLKIVSTGRLTWKKGFEYSLQALSLLDCDFRYYIIGEGEDLERLTYAAYQLGISDKVVFMGKKPHNEISEILRSCDIYLQPSVQEGFCNSVLEAQASGALCIVSDAEGLQENVENMKSGFVVPKRNPKAIADKIKTIVAMTDIERQNMQDYAAARVKRLFDVKDQIAAFINFYH